MAQEGKRLACAECGEAAFFEPSDGLMLCEQHALEHGEVRCAHRNCDNQACYIDGDSGDEYCTIHYLHRVRKLCSMSTCQSAVTWRKGSMFLCHTHFNLQEFEELEQSKQLKKKVKPPEPPAATKTAGAGDDALWDQLPKVQAQQAELIVKMIKHHHSMGNSDAAFNFHFSPHSVRQLEKRGFTVYPYVSGTRVTWERALK